MEAFHLVEPSLEYQFTFLDMAKEFGDGGHERYQTMLPQLLHNFSGYVQRLKLDSTGIKLRPGIVPQTTFWSVEAGNVIGVVRIRHYLTPQLALVGGHIGYEIRPSRRRQGYGTRQLALALEELHRWGWLKALITCDDDNIGSARIIESNGGKLWDKVVVPGQASPIRRYWINLACSNPS